MNKSKLYCVLFFSAAFCFAQDALYAQDAPDNEHFNGFEEKPSPEHETTPATYNYTESENVRSNVASPSSKATVMPRDSAAMRVAPVQRKAHDAANSVRPQAPGNSGSSDDSILSFNFIYYIIQKFKMQDIIE